MNINLHFLIHVSQNCTQMHRRKIELNSAEQRGALYHNVDPGNGIGSWLLRKLTAYSMPQNRFKIKLHYKHWTA